jgi:hypothetical protein
VGLKRLTGRSADQEVRPTLGAGGFGFLDEFAELGEIRFAGGSMRPSFLRASRIGKRLADGQRDHNQRQN